MPIDLSGFIEAIQRGFGQIPPVAIAIALLAGPTAALIGYRLIGSARRAQASTETAEALWVCRDCRSVNQLRLSRCYRCGLAVDATDEIDVVLDLPTSPQRAFEVPSGSPFAAAGGPIKASEVGDGPASGDHLASGGPGVPVMADRSALSDPLPVGPGHLAGIGVGVGVRPSAAKADPVRPAERDA